MIDDAAAGRTVFYDIYTDAVKQAGRSRHNTGLFFFRGKAGAPFPVIAPGGGFAYVGSLHEGFPYAVEISNRGYNAFVLKYRAGRGGTVATEDLAAALSYIFRNADALGVTTAGYSLWGAAASGRSRSKARARERRRSQGDVAKRKVVLRSATAARRVQITPPRDASAQAPNAALRSHANQQMQGAQQSLERSLHRYREFHHPGSLPAGTDDLL